MTYNQTNTIKFTVRSRTGNWTGDTPECFSPVLRHKSEDGGYKAVATLKEIQDSALHNMDDVTVPESLRMVSNQLNNTLLDEGWSERNDFANEIAPFGATDISHRVRLAPSGNGRGKWNATLDVDYTDALGKRVTTSMRFWEVTWDRWGNNTSRMEFAKHVPNSVSVATSNFCQNFSSLRRPGDMAHAALTVLAKKEGCELSKHGNAWQLTIPDGKCGFEGTKIRSRIATSMSLFCGGWTVDSEVYVAGIHDLEDLCKSAHQILDQADDVVREIDDEGYDTFDKYSYKGSVAARLSRSLESTSRFKKEVTHLSNRLEDTHSRLVQVVENAKSISQGCTSHLFE